MILGLGIDIIEIERIKKSVDEYGSHFLDKIYTQTERDYSLAKANKYQHLAARFAAKEAIIKALADIGEMGFKYQDIEIYNEKNGSPKVKLDGTLKEFVGDDKALKISMSHSDHYVTCVAILYMNHNNKS